jgi:hypothetical protein
MQRFSPVTGVQLGGSLAGKLASEDSSTTSRFFWRFFSVAGRAIFDATLRTGTGFRLAAIAASPQTHAKYVGTEAMLPSLTALATKLSARKSTIGGIQCRSCGE